MSEGKVNEKTNVEEVANYAEFEERRRKIQVIRWIAVVVYVVVVLSASLVPLAMEVDPVSYSLLLIILIVILTGGLIAVIVFPYFNKLKLPDRIDGSPLEGFGGGDVDLSRSYQDRITMKALIYSVVLVIIIMVPVMTFNLSMGGATISAGVFVLIILICIIFMNLYVVCSPTALSFHYGPIGKTIPIEDIASIRSTSIHPLKDFMGWGIRVGSDGTIGYIAAGNVGVRIQLKDGKQYVVTLSDPQSLVEYVEAAKQTAQPQ